MDVLELPRPVINFLRTMAKESCRYALSWDIFGGPDSVTLTLTWKLIDEESQSSMINEAAASLKQQQQQNYDDTSNRIRSTTKTNTSTSSPRRSRRDDHTSSNENASVPAIFRSSRGKSLEDPPIHSSKQMTSHQHHPQHQLQHTKEHSHVSSLERTTVPNHYQHHHHRTKKEQQQQQQKQAPISSDQSYGKLYETRSSPVVKCATVSSLSSSSPSPQPNNNNINNNNNPSLSATFIHNQRVKPQQLQSTTPPTSRKTIRPLTNVSRTPTLPLTSPTATNYTKLKQNDNIALHNDFDDDDDDDSALDPWVKRFECSLGDHDEESTEHSEEKETMPSSSTLLPNLDDAANTSGKVKFKTKPDYF